MPIDRDAALKTAERLLRQGKLDGAIEQYVRLVEEQPRDWASINALGDLYVRAGNTERGVAQYVRIADHLFGEGFLPKAAALYKKALKVRQDHEHTLLRLSEIAAQQGLLADAKLYLRQLGQQRKGRGDERGAAECILRIAGLDEDDGDAKVTAAKTAEAIGEIGQAVTLLQDAASAFDKQKRESDALEARMAAVALAPDDVRLRNEVARALIAAGQLDRAQPFMSTESAGEDVDLLLAVGRSDLLAGRSAEAHATLMRVAALAPARQDAIAALANEMLDAGRIADGYACVEVLVDAALFEAIFDRATRLLEEFIQRHRLVPALLKLVDVYVDAGLDERITAVQAQLVDTYLEAGQAAEARIIAEDLLAREPQVEVHSQRLRRALDALGVDNPDEIIARLRDTDPLLENAFDVLEDDLTFDTPASTPVADHPPASAEPPAQPKPVAQAEPALPPPPPPPPPEAAPVPAPLEVEIAFVPESPAQRTEPAEPVVERKAPVRNSFEIDLNTTLAELNAAPASRPSAPSRPEQAPPSPTLSPQAPIAAARRDETPITPGRAEQVSVAPNRAEQAPMPAPRGPDAVEPSRPAGPVDEVKQAAELFQRAQEHLRNGAQSEAAAALRTAAHVPQWRFKAAAQLGQIAASRGDLRGAVEWLERAAEAPSPSVEEGFAVIYDLADALDRVGEPVRALALFMELEGDAGAYRDVAARIDTLTARAAGPSPGLGERR